MSQIAAVAAWGPDARPGVGGGDLATAWRKDGITSMHVGHAPGAQIAWATRAAGVDTVSDRCLLTEPDLKVAVVADCRLDNGPEVRAELGIAPGAGDALLLVRAYEKWGDDFPTRLKGDFTGVVWDWGRQRLVAFRDAVGIRPLFYSTHPGGIVLASDVETLMSLTRDAGKPDDQLIVEYLTWDYHSGDRTFWTRLGRLDGGHILVAGPQRTDVRRYWHPPQRELSTLAVDAFQEKFRELFIVSVKRCLDAGAPMLAHLSGGLDSSSIVCVADQIYRQTPHPTQPLRAVSARYPGLMCDEGRYIEAVTRSISLPFESWDGRSDEFPDLDVPSAAGPGWRTHRAGGSDGEFTIARRIGARVILSGAGGDHVGAPFGVAEHRARTQPVCFAYQTFARTDLTLVERAGRIRFLLRTLAPRRLRLRIAASRQRRRLPDWLQPRWRELVADLTRDERYRLHESFTSCVQEAHWMHLTGASMGLSLDADSRCSSASGLEMRYPFLDRDLVEFMLALPAHIWESEEDHFRLHRAALADLLPFEIRNRHTKAWFSSAIALRIQRASGRLRALFHGEHWLSERWVDQLAAQRLLERTLSEGLADPKWSDLQALREIGNLEGWLRAAFGYTAPA